MLAVVTVLKAGDLEFKSHLSSLFSLKVEKRALRFVALFASVFITVHCHFLGTLSLFGHIHKGIHVTCYVVKIIIYNIAN